MQHVVFPICKSNAILYTHSTRHFSNNTTEEAACPTYVQQLHFRIEEHNSKTAVTFSKYKAAPLLWKAKPRCPDHAPQQELNCPCFKNKATHTLNTISGMRTCTFWITNEDIDKWRTKTQKRTPHSPQQEIPNTKRAKISSWTTNHNTAPAPNLHESVTNWSRADVPPAQWKTQSEVFE